MRPAAPLFSLARYPAEKHGKTLTQYTAHVNERNMPTVIGAAVHISLDIRVTLSQAYNGNSRPLYL